MLDQATRQELQKLFDTLQLPELGPGPRPGIKPEVELKKCLASLLGNSNTRTEQRELISALVLLWHDDLDAAHAIAQEIGDATGSLVHGIMHRREPDYGNAAYWFRRVGKHPAFSEFASRAGKALAAKGESELARKLIPGGEWDPFAFISACEAAARSGTPDARTGVLRELQAIESRALLDWICSDSRE